MQNLSLETLERENLCEAACARRRDLILERFTGRHNNKAEVA